MVKDVTFSLDEKGGADILQKMAQKTIKVRAGAMASRARSMASSMSSDPPEIKVNMSVGTIKRGARAIATITAEGNDPHSRYIGHVVLAKSKDAIK